MQNGSGPVPLAERLRPKTVEEVIRQAHYWRRRRPWGRCLPPDIDVVDFLGPPGVGKTTLARLLADLRIFSLNKSAQFFRAL